MSIILISLAAFATSSSVISLGSLDGRVGKQVIEVLAIAPRSAVWVILDWVEMIASSLPTGENGRSRYTTANSVKARSLGC
ncbi:MAG: hypothetical protein SAK29_33010 [Scytonema sp. PMC 1069.18]|nr:hypothetical protein [Scytonema sp. PMC 1069.18]MEC4880448.1 hypothetical protein [Scytonema sp. PMC 1070.18]